MAQEVETINSEADVGIRREAVDSVEGKLTESDLRRSDPVGTETQEAC